MRQVNSVFQEAYGFAHPDIVFTSKDFEGVKPHADDPVVVTLKISKFTMRKVLLDHGSSADIIYGATFDQMGLSDKDLIHYTGNLVGFLGERVDVRGYKIGRAHV